MTSSHLNKPQLLASREMLTLPELHRLDAYWRACNYLCAGMIYLRDNPLLKEPLRPEHFKNRLLGHWGSDPGQTFVWVHLNRVIRKYDLDMIYISGPGHGAPAVISNCYLEGTYSEIYPEKSQDEAGLLKLFRAFSFPGQLGSHCTPEVPGSIHEGGELGYSLSHAFGAAFDNPDLIVSVVVGDGEAETGPLATSWHSNKFLNPIRDGAVLPILHLNGYKIANPTVLARISSGGTRRSFQGLRLDAACSGGRRSRVDASADGRHGGGLRPADSVDSARGQADRQAGASALADDHPAHSERMDRTETGGRSQSRGVLASPPSAGTGREIESRASADRRAVDAQLSAGGTVRSSKAR